MKFFLVPVLFVLCLAFTALAAKPTLQKAGKPDVMHYAAKAHASAKPAMKAKKPTAYCMTHPKAPVCK